MKNTFAATGVLALSAASLVAAQTSGLSRMDTAKPWSISASLRGFYDDNYTTSPNNIAPNSFGFEASPSASLNLPMDQTFLGLSYLYSIRYYENRASNSADHSHQFSGKLDHAFTERYKLSINESFVLAQEPQVLDPTGIITVPLRTDGNNLRNIASADFTAQLTQLTTMQIAYANTIYDYEQRGFGSRSALLDRMEHAASVNFRWQAFRQTVGVIGYQFSSVEYTSKDPLFFNFFPTATLPFGFVSPSVRDNRSHYVFTGIDQNINAQLNASVRVGAQYTEYFNMGTDDISPYADANLTYAYAPGAEGSGRSYLQLGIRHARNQTDVLSPTTTSVTQDQESTAVYASLTHNITAKLTASLLGQFQHSTFNNGGVNSLVDNFFIVGGNLAYKINPNWMAETGYNFDRLDSDIVGRSYTRNRVYIGVRATY